MVFRKQTKKSIAVVDLCRLRCDFRHIRIAGLSSFAFVFASFSSSFQCHSDLQMFFSIKTNPVRSIITIWEVLENTFHRSRASFFFFLKFMTRLESPVFVQQTQIPYSIAFWWNLCSITFSLSLSLSLSLPLKQLCLFFYVSSVEANVFSNWLSLSRHGLIGLLPVFGGLLSFMSSIFSRFLPSFHSLCVHSACPLIHSIFASFHRICTSIFLSQTSSHAESSLIGLITRQSNRSSRSCSFWSVRSPAHSSDLFHHHLLFVFSDCFSI